MLSTPPGPLVEGMPTVSGDGPADLDPGRLSEVGDVETPVRKSRLAMESARGILLVGKALALGAGDDCWSVRGLAAAKRAVACCIKGDNAEEEDLKGERNEISFQQRINKSRGAFIVYQEPLEKKSLLADFESHWTTFSLNFCFTSIPFREGGRGTAMLPRVGVLPRELGACNRPCLGGRAGTISPTSSNRSSPAGRICTQNEKSLVNATKL